MIKIKRVRALDNHLLECLFENNEIVIYDMAYVLEQDTPMLDPLKNESFFREVFLESGAPVWKNGYDLCPDAIWTRTRDERGQKVDYEIFDPEAEYGRKDDHVN